MKRAVLIAFIITFPLFVYGTLFEKPETLGAEVVRVIDGDTVEVSLDGRNETVRLIGVDTPEVHSSNNPEFFGLPDNSESKICLEKWGKKSTEFVIEKTLKENTIMVLEGDRRDQYGRLRAYIVLEDSGESLNFKLLQEGYATVYPTDFSRKTEFESVEKAARKDNKGVWRC